MLLVAFDTNCINARGRDPSMSVMEAWHADGRLRLRPTFRVLVEARDPLRSAKAKRMGILPEPAIWGVSAWDTSCYYDASGPPFDKIARILFPRVPRAQLSQNQKNDVMHVITAIGVDADILVSNDQDITASTKADALRSLGLLVLSSADAVAHLRSRFGWT